MAGKRSNGEGSISYDKRRKTYRAKVTIGWEVDEKTGRAKQIVKTLGSSYKTKGEASRALAEYLKNPFDLNNKDWIEIDRVSQKSMYFEVYSKKQLLQAIDIIKQNNESK